MKSKETKIDKLDSANTTLFSSLIGSGAMHKR